MQVYHDNLTAVHQVSVHVETNQQVVLRPNGPSASRPAPEALCTLPESWRGISTLQTHTYLSVKCSCYNENMTTALAVNRNALHVLD